MTLNRVGRKIRKDIEEHIKQNVLAEQSKFYSIGEDEDAEGGIGDEDNDDEFGDQEGNQFDEENEEEGEEEDDDDDEGNGEIYDEDDDENDGIEYVNE